MKKLLVLLSVLIVGSTALPTTISATLFSKKNSEIDYYKINNTKKIKENNEEKILYIDKDLIIDLNNPDIYGSSFKEVIKSLVNNNILIIEFKQKNKHYSTNEDTRLYSLNSKKYDYFVINVSIKQIENININLQLVFRTKNIYLDGIIVETLTRKVDGGCSLIKNYYHFPDSDLKKIKGTTSTSFNNNIIGNRKDPITNIYRNILWLTKKRKFDQNIYWEDIYNSFFQLTNLGQNISHDNHLIALDLSMVIFVTSEALRFRSIGNLIINNLSNKSYGNQSNIVWKNNRDNEKNINEILLNWYKNKNKKINYLNTILIKKNLDPNNKLVSKKYENKFLLNLSLEDLTEFLSYENSLKILIISIIENFDYKKNSKKYKRNTYNLITDKITVVKIINKNNKDNNLKHINIYVGTDNGIYCIYNNGEIDKFKHLNFPINDIIFNDNKNIYIINDKGEFYQLNFFIWSSTKLHLLESHNLEKELKIYFRNDHTDDKIVYDYLYRNYNYSVYHTVNIGKINPTNYEKIEFLGNNFNITRISWGNRPYFAKRTIKSYNNRDVVNFIKNIKIEDNRNHIEKNINNSLQSVADCDSGTNFCGQQHFGVTWYYENGNYYLQFSVKQYAEKLYGVGGAVFMGLGNSFRLYNF